MKTSLRAGLIIVCLAVTPTLSAQTASTQSETASVGFDVHLDAISSGYDGKTCWVHPRAGTIPGEHPIVVLTMQKLLLKGSDVFYALNEKRTDDLGATWSGPAEHATLGRRQEANGLVTAICDFTPKWHVRTGKLLGTGHIAKYRGDRLASDYARQTAYSVYNPQERSWTRWRTVRMPEDERFYSSGAGSTQRIDLPNGDVLLPIYFKAKGEKCSTTTVMRCRFDGTNLSYLEHGTEMTIDVPRGFGEPSLTLFHGQFYLTLRNDKAGYVTSGADGLHFDKPRKWTFDGGRELGNYNTQQHWVTHSDGLFLVYTRRGADNDHVFRHRAPLFIAQVDPDRLCVLRDTERVLVPERGARLGNFGVTDVNEHETWVTVAEWMQTWGPNYVMPVNNKYGADNTVFVARIQWHQPNRLASR